MMWCRSLVFLSCLATALLAAWPCAATAADATTVTSYLIEEAGKAAHIRALLPRAAKLEPGLWQKLLHDAQAEIADFRKIADEDLGLLEKGQSWQPYTFDMFWTEHFVSDRFVSLLQMNYQYTGGAHGNIDFRTLLWDRKIQGPIGLEQILKEAGDDGSALRAVAAYAREELIRLKVRQSGFTLEEARRDPALDELMPTREVFANLTLQPSSTRGLAAGLTFHFAPYYLGSYAEGSYRLFVPSHVFSAYLDSAYAGYFEGKPLITTPLIGLTGAPVILTLEGISERERIASPLHLKGEAPPDWFVNGTAAVEVATNSGEVLARGEIRPDPKQPASGATYGTLPFTGRIAFQQPQPGTQGLIRFVHGGIDPASSEARRQSVLLFVGF